MAALFHFITSRSLSVLVAALLSLLPSPAFAQSTSLPKDSLLRGFLDPPPGARMRMYWRVFGPAWTKEGIDHQLGLLKEAGVGGVMLMPFYPVALDDPAKGIHNQPFLSKEFLETFGYAARKAKSLGLRFSVEGGTGWPFGGPTVTLADAAQRVRRVEVPAGAPLPALREGEQILTAWQGGKRLDPADPLGVWRPSAPSAPKRNATDSVPPKDIAGRRTGAPTERTPSRRTTGASAEPLTLFITGPTFMKVKRPALGADGYVLDHYNSPALTRWLDAIVKPLLDAAPGLVESIFCDSLEVYNANWTHDFPVEFRNRRGYDLIPRLPEMYDEKAPASPDLRFDFWRTLAELNEERFTKPLAAWAKRHGVKLEMESYGTPPSPLTSFRHIDVPTGEQYERMGFSLSRYAASGGHLAGKRVIGAEAWTWTGIPNRLIDSLRDLKLASDFHFLAGINDLVGVDFAYSPPSVPPPGWLPYFGPVMNQNNPQWPYFKYLVQYVNRCQWLLRQGKPVAQVALYLPVEQMFAHGPIDQMLLDFHLRDHFVTDEKTGEFGLENARKHRSELIHTLITHGYNFDGIDFWTLIRHAKVKNGKLICGDGEYSIVILPNVEGMELEALEKLADFVRSGGTLIATGRLPDRAYGAAPRLAGRNEDIKRLSRALFGMKVDDDLSTFTYARSGKGRAIFGGAKPLTSVLGLALMSGDSTLAPYGAQPNVGTVVRKTPDCDIAFVANTGDSPTDVHFGYRVFDDWGSRPVWQLDPALGARALKAGAGQESRELLVRLPARGSVFFLYPRSRPVRNDGNAARRSENRAETARAAPLEPLPQSTTSHLDSLWSVTADGRAPFRTASLTSLSARAGWEYFSGQATYETTFEWNGSLPVILREPKATEESASRVGLRAGKADSSARIASPQNDRGTRATSPQNDRGARATSPQNDGRGSSVRLRFGEVREAGEVWVNGKLAGGIWLPPYEVEIGPLLKRGKNLLKLTVGNTMLNRFLALPDEDLRPLRAAYGNRFPDPQEKKMTKDPPPSGLIGPVEIIRD